MGQTYGNISINQSKQIKEIYQKQGQMMISKKSCFVKETRYITKLRGW